MRQQLLLILICTVITIAVALFSVGSAMGFSDEPCYGVNYECDNCREDCIPPPDPPSQFTDPSGWTIELLSISPDGDNFNWHYRISKNGSVKGLNFAAWLIPLCCTDPRVIVFENLSTPANGTFFAPGAGEPTVVLAVIFYSRACSK